MTTKHVRTRFAPSPTGYMHVGNLRTALYAFLIAKKSGGDFILRIEDTDRERYVENAVDTIYQTLKSVNIYWNEGPDVGGEFGPYIQSMRQEIYKKHAMQLVEQGKAYYCFCDKQKLEEAKMIQIASGMSAMYNRHCRNLSNEQIQENLKNNVPFVIRQKMPLEGTTTFNDIIFGEISVDNCILDDQILIKADGMPTYNFANVIDDHLMQITHVVRGNEYLSSTPKYNLLYEAFGWDKPIYIHCSPVMKNATEKLSKRNGDASFNELVEKGFLPEAVVNYIALLGWSPKGEEEIFSLEELIEQFSIDGISKSPAIFDIVKLKAINGYHIRRMSEEEFCEIAKPYIEKSVKSQNVDISLISKLLKSRTEILTDIPEQIDFIDFLPEYNTELFINKKMKTTEESSLNSLEKLLPVLEELDTWSANNIHDAVFDTIKLLEVKNGIVLWPLRVALSGKKFTPGGGIDICEILGKEESLNRIKIAVKKLSHV